MKDRRQQRHNAGSETGLALLVALIVLVVMSLAGVALVRSVDTGILVAGNLAFRQSGTHAGDAGVETARSWLITNISTLANDNPAQGYYANSQSNLDLTGNKTPGNTSDDVAWGGPGTGISTPWCKTTADDGGNKYCYIIHRLCDSSGTALDSATCTTKTGTKGGSSMGGIRPMTTYQEASWSDVTSYGYYRVTVRVSGPRNNVTFVQAFLVI